MNPYLLELLFENVVPGGLVNIAYLIMSIAMIFQAPLFPPWSHEFFRGFFMSVIVIQGIQLATMMGLALYIGGPKKELPIVNGKPTPVLTADECGRAIKSFGVIGLIGMASYILWAIYQNQDTVLVMGRALAAGSFLELIFRKFPDQVEEGIFRTLIYTSLAGVAGALFVLVLGGGRAVTEIHEMAYIGLVFFGFRWLWQIGFANVVAELFD